MNEMIEVINAAFNSSVNVNIFTFANLFSLQFEVMSLLSRHFNWNVIKCG